jgi:hypothetical protein
MKIPTCLTPWPLVGMPPKATKALTLVDTLHDGHMESLLAWRTPY